MFYSTRSESIPSNNPADLKESELTLLVQEHVEHPKILSSKTKNNHNNDFLNNIWI